MQKVLVLGAGGFVGSHLVTALSLAEGLVPIAGLRRAGAGNPSVAMRVCDATDNLSVKRALAGIDCVVNCVGGSPATMLRATENICHIGRISGLRRIVHISSMAVYGDATGEVDEDRPLPRPGSPYAHAKHASELAVRDYVRAGGDAVILRPGCVHGPGSDQWTARIGRLLASRRIGDLGAAGDGICNLTYIDDLVAAIIAALHRPQLAGQVYNIADPEPRTWNRYFVQFGRLIGATPIRRIPEWRLTMERVVLAPALRSLGIFLRGGVPDPITPSLLRLWRQDVRLLPDRADAVLGFPRVAPKAALAEAAAWWRAERSSIRTLARPAGRLIQTVARDAD